MSGAMSPLSLITSWRTDGQFWKYSIEKPGSAFGHSQLWSSYISPNFQTFRKNHQHMLGFYTITDTSQNNIVP